MASSSTNWLFSLASPVEFVSSDQLLFDNFYENGWSEKSQEFHIPGQQENQASDLHVQIQYENNNKNNSSMMLNNLINIEENQDIPQLEGFLGGANTTHETQIYDINGLTGFRGFSLSPGVDGSGSIGKSQLGTELAGQSNEPSMTQFNCPTGVVANKKTSKKAVETDCTKVADHTYCQRSSIDRGVTRHRWTGRYEVHLWDNSIKQKRQNGRQVYLGGYDKQDKAARAYDMGALKYWGAHAKTNFPASDYLQQMEEMKHLTRLEFIAAIRRKSCGFSRGASVYRGVTRHHQQGRWQARIGRVSGNRDMYLGTFLFEEEAAEAYDVAAIKFRGIKAVTNFEMSCYDVEAIMKCPLPVGGAKRQKISLESEQNPPVDNGQQLQPTRRNDNVNVLGVQPITTIPHGISYNDANIYGRNTFPPVLSNNIIDTPNASRLNHAYRNSNANAQDAAVS